MPSVGLLAVFATFIAFNLMFPKILLDDQESVKVDGCRRVVKFLKNVATPMGLRQRNQRDKENAHSGWMSGNEQPALDVASSSKHMEF